MDKLISYGVLLATSTKLLVQGCGVKIVQDGVSVVPVYHWSSEHCLNIVPYKTDWYQAYATCAEKRGELMIINNEEQQTEMVQALRAAKELRGWSFWIGLYQMDATDHTSYQWVDTPLQCSYNQDSDRRNCVKGSYKVNKLLCNFQRCCHDDSKIPKCTFPVVPETFIGYSAWGKGSPTVSNDRMCVIMKDAQLYRWKDLPCLPELSSADNVGFICRFKESPAPGATRPTYPPAPSTPETEGVGNEGITPNVTWIAIGIVALLLLIIITSAIVVCCLRKKRRDQRGL